MRVNWPDSPRDRIRITRSLGKLYTFQGGMVMTLGDYLRTKNLTRKSLYIRHYSRSKRELEYKLLKKPAKEYSVWYDDDGVESGIEIDAELYHALDLPASESEEPVHTERTSYEFKHIAPPWAGG